MPYLTFPFWLISERRPAADEASHIPCDDPLALHAFTTRERLDAYLDQQRALQWDIFQLNSSEAVRVALSNAKYKGATDICFDPNADGSGGELVSVIDLLTACDPDGDFDEKQSPQ